MPLHDHCLENVPPGIRDDITVLDGNFHFFTAGDYLAGDKLNNGAGIPGCLELQRLRRKRFNVNGTNRAFLPGRSRGKQGLAVPRHRFARRYRQIGGDALQRACIPVISSTEKTISSSSPVLLRYTLQMSEMRSSFFSSALALSR